MIFSARVLVALTLGLVAFASSPVCAVRAVRHPHGEPKILSVSLSRMDVAPGQSVTARVATTPNVGYVEARVENYNQALKRQSTGKFALSYTVPLYLAPMVWLKHAWTLQIIARSVDGVEVRKNIPIRLH
jgi:hypothetical protein